MNAVEYLRSVYKRWRSPPLANFALPDLAPDTSYQLAAFTLADDDGRVVLIRRTPIAAQPGIETYWWIPGGAQERGEQLDQTAVREFQEETGLHIAIHHTLLAQLGTDRPFITVFFRGTVIGGTLSASADPDNITAEARFFHPGEFPFHRLWSDADKILLVRERFAAGPIENLIAKNALQAPLSASRTAVAGENTIQPGRALSTSQTRQSSSPHTRQKYDG